MSEKIRTYLTEAEVERMFSSVSGRHKVRDQALILLSFRHALRASEACSMQWAQVNLDDAILHVRRSKNGQDSNHYLTGREVRLLRRLKAEQQPGAFVFRSQKGGPLTRKMFHVIVRRTGQAAGLDVPAHPHMLRHGAGFHLANAGKDTRSLQDYLGHKDIRHTVRYTTMSPNRFKDFWTD